MALPGHSSPHRYTGPGSPHRALNGFSESQLATSMNGAPRSMLPPSPQHYQPRFPATTVASPSAPLPTFQDVKTGPPPHKRPGSSMSISSMLGGEPERSRQDFQPTNHTRAPSYPGSIPEPPFHARGTNFMSPPRQLPGPTLNDFPYKSRSRTPDRVETSNFPGQARQRSSSSGTAMQRPGLFIEPYNRSTASTPAIRSHEPYSVNHPLDNERREQEERVRRTSINGILQRPSSQPQNPATISQIHSSYQTHPPPPLQLDPKLSQEPSKINGTNGLYDTKPPGMNGLPKPSFRNNPSPPKTSPLSLSPELQRPTLNGGSQGRGLFNMWNGPTSRPAEPLSAGSQRMSRQDSTQSQGERSILGERGKFRPYSPFASPFTSNPDEQGRKGSDELSQHRAILGLSSDSKRGRYSPVPQAVQGAQAQTPVPDAGVKTERGRVFSGIGGGVRTTPTPSGLPSSPLKKEDGPMRLSEDNLKNWSRSTSGVNKRSRKATDDDYPIEIDAASGEKANGRKKGKHQHNYKADLEEMAQAGFPRRSTPSAGPNLIKRNSTPANYSNNVGYQQRLLDTTPVFKSRKVVRVASVFDAVSKKPRQHLGSFTYRPNISQSDTPRSGSKEFEVAVTPNLLPSFTASHHVNCTYTVHVPRLWLQSRERGLICAERYLWGSGIYTDDSDPVAAAIHAGFLKASFADGVDTNLLGRIVHEQNPQIEFPKSLKLPKEPKTIIPNKDLNITLVVLPLLETYEGSTRFGIRSRSWPDSGERTQHDGVSFGVLNIEFVDVGVEELRVGRTGRGRRERLRKDLEARRRGFEVQQQRLAAIRKKRVEKLSRQISEEKALTGVRSVSKPVPTAVVNQAQGNVARASGSSA